jgi:hypothetical protein
MIGTGIRLTGAVSIKDRLVGIIQNCFAGALYRHMFAADSPVDCFTNPFDIKNSVRQKREVSEL